MIQEGYPHFNAMNYFIAILPLAFAIFGDARVFAEMKLAENAAMEIPSGKSENIEIRKRRLDREIEKAEQIVGRELEVLDPETVERETAALLGQGEKLAAKDYLGLESLTPVPKSILIFTKESGSSLFRNSEGGLFLILSGKIRRGYEVLFGNVRLRGDAKQRFKVRLELPNRSGAIPVIVQNKAGQARSYQYLLNWKKMPQQIGLRIREEEGTVTEVSRGINMVINPSSFAQLYRKEHPTYKLEGESGKLAFRILSSNVPRENVEWEITVLDKDQNVAGQKKGSGVPPTEIDWETFAEQIKKPGAYAYYVDLRVDGELYKGNANRFELIFPEEKKFASLAFRLSSVSAFQSGALSSSAELSWNPTYRLMPRLSLVGHFGFTAFNKAGGGSFLSTRYQALARYETPESRFFGEAGPGAQTWVGFGGTRLTLTANFGYRRNDGFGFKFLDNLAFLDRFVAGYTMVMATPVVHQVSLGVGFKL